MANLEQLEKLEQVKTNYINNPNDENLKIWEETNDG